MVPLTGIVVGVLAFLGARKPGRHQTLATLWCISLGVSLLFVLGTVAATIANSGMDYDSSCWTF
jgi:hypothetical protein